MPFTFAHPALILPLTTSKRFSATALITGSMTPDLEYFLQMREVENIGHSWFGVIIFDFPLALALCFLFHNLLKVNLVLHLPAFVRNRVAAFEPIEWNKYFKNHYATVSLSLLIGIASHILWDGFTHHNGLFVEIFPRLYTSTILFGSSLALYFVLQLVFSFLGLGILLFSFFRLPVKNHQKVHQKNLWYWPFSLGLLSLILCIRLIFWPQYNSFWGVFMAVMGSIIYSWTLVSLIFKLFKFKKVSI